ncbi:hypothetical protein EV361DRAFT_872973 [Lentinula raphanica]|nr:hypothetical protein EV361DRAFT_872973 [Lentinula raphanica]
MKLRTSILASVLLGVSLVNATAWVAGYQSSGYTGWNLRQYTDLYVGNPRMVAYIFGSDANTLPGAVCGSWTEWNIITNPNPGDPALLMSTGVYDFNCIATPDDINNNARNNGFYVGGLNHEGVTVAQCYIEYSGSELCDTDTISDPNDRACNVWIVSQSFVEPHPKHHTTLINGHTNISSY